MDTLSFLKSNFISHILHANHDVYQQDVFLNYYMYPYSYIDEFLNVNIFNCTTKDKGDKNITRMYKKTNQI